MDLAELPKMIEQLEQKQAVLHETIGKPEFYQEAENKIAKTQQELDLITIELETAYERWDSLEAKQKG